MRILLLGLLLACAGCQADREDRGSCRPDAAGSAQTAAPAAQAGGGNGAAGSDASIQSSPASAAGPASGLGVTRPTTTTAGTGGAPDPTAAADPPATGDLFNEPNAIIRRERLTALEAARDPRLAGLARQALRDRDPTVIIQAAQHLGRLAERGSVEDLLKALGASRGRVDGYGPPIQQAVIAALGACQDPSALPALIAILERHEDLSMDNTAVEALGRIGDPTATAALDRHILRLEGLRPREALAEKVWMEALRLARECRARLGVSGP